MLSCGLYDADRVTSIILCDFLLKFRERPMQVKTTGCNSRVQNIMALQDLRLGLSPLCMPTVVMCLWLNMIANSLPWILPLPLDPAHSVIVIVIVIDLTPADGDGPLYLLFFPFVGFFKFTKYFLLKMSDPYSLGLKCVLYQSLVPQIGRPFGMRA